MEILLLRRMFRQANLSSTSTQNPILDFLNEVLSNEDTKVDVSDWKSYQMSLVLKDCDYDLQKVEAKMRQYYFAQIMRRPYRELLSSSQSSMIRRTLFDRLIMCQLYFVSF